jgi:hypothetical protein
MGGYRCPVSERRILPRHRLPQQAGGITEGEE